jgi:hypothetical protein
MGSLCSQRVSASAALHIPHHNSRTDRPIYFIFLWHSGSVGEAPYRFRARSDIQYGRQADILDFVFRTLTAEQVTRLISYFCGIAGGLRGRRPIAFGRDPIFNMAAKADILDFVFQTVTAEPIARLFIISVA